MKKHEMVLDFTSLLDVILIILFLVLCSMNGKAQKDAKKIDDLEASNVVLSGEIEQLTGRVDNLEQQNTELSESLDEVKAASLEKGQEVDRLTQEIARLEELLETATQLAKTYEKMNGMNAADAKRYELLKYDTQAITLRITKSSTIDDYHYYVTLIAEGIKSVGYMIENATINDSPDKNYRYQNKFAAWLQTELDKIAEEKDLLIFQINIVYDESVVQFHPLEIVVNAANKLDESHYLVLVYENDNKI